MATYAKIVSVTMTQYENSMLGPAPNVTDWDYMKNEIDADTTPAFENLSDAMGMPLKILTSYRGWTVYLQGGISYIRTNPTTTGGNGYVSLPKSGKEMGRMHWKGSVYHVEVEYMSESQPLSVHVYYHLPGAEEVTFAESYDNFEDARSHAETKIALEQYVAIIKDDNVGLISRYLFTPGCGPLSCLPMEGGGYNKKLSNIVNFVMASEELPAIPGEDEE
jgi:hypothetical protein